MSDEGTGNTETELTGRQQKKADRQARAKQRDDALDEMLHGPKSRGSRSRGAVEEKPSGIPTWSRFAFCLILTAIGCVLVPAGLGAFTYDGETNIAQLIIGGISLAGAFYNLIVGAVTRGIIDAR